MPSYIVTVHEHPFILSEAQEIRFREDVVAAVREGGAFVDFEHEEGAASALVSGATALLIRGVPTADLVDGPPERIPSSPGQITPFVRRKTQ